MEISEEKKILSEFNLLEEKNISLLEKNFELNEKIFL